MIAICRREFISLFKSVKSVIFILIITGMTFLIADLMSGIPPEELEGMGLKNGYVTGLMFLMYFFGPLFVTSLSHDIINREEQSRTLRFLVTKIHRDKIVLGKFLGILSFWVACLFLALVLISIFTRTFYLLPFLENIVFLSYFISLSIFISTIVNRPTFSMFLGIILSIALPVVGFWALVSKSNMVINILSVFTPYYYFGFTDQPIIGYLTIILTLLLLISSLLIFRKRDF
ncbi:ABC transporter permease [Metabacillus idriensis]|uniref:ABC transporter permease n=1 Tax=Metabacillus idriensis TaxID=324768 RepID=UPI001749FBEB|nr:ABC transporter permease [Metabacillus idriensis]